MVGGGGSGNGEKSLFGHPLVSSVLSGEGQDENLAHLLDRIPLAVEHMLCW